MNNEFKKIWDPLEKPETQPSRVSKVIEIEFEELERKTYEQDPRFVRSIVESLYEGTGYLVKRAFPPEFMIELREKAYQYGKTRPSSFHKMLQGCPDFHRAIDPELAKNYTFQAVKHSYYFFPWNDDPLKLFPMIYRRWRVFKLIGGFAPDAYEKNRPKDGVVDRIQIVQYPRGIGSLETHCDPYQNQRVIISGYMSKRGIDYQTGGFYFVEKEDSRGESPKIYIEDNIDIGDMAIGYATVLHGVTLVDKGKPIDWNSIEGRWYLGFYSNSSDEVQTRHMGRPVSVKTKDRL